MAQHQFTVYVIELQDGRHYVGHTNNLPRRLAEHQSGRSPFTRRAGFRLLRYSETYPTRAAARQREKFLKTGKGREWLHALLDEQSASGG